jgi:hypothetical protein
MEQTKIKVINFDLKEEQEVMYEEIKSKVMDKEVSSRLFKNSDDDGTPFNYNSEDDPCSVVNFDDELHYIQELQCVDIVFVVDCTSSMKSIFRGIKKFIRKLVWDANKCLTKYLTPNPEKIRVGLVKYRDHPPQNKTFVTEVFQLTSNFKSFKDEVNKMTAQGGGDMPEAVLDGLQAALNLNWRDESFKFIYHLLDSPPHGRTFTDAMDAFPGGCPCGIDYESVLSEMRAMSIQYNIIKLSNEIDRMINVFSEIMPFDVMNPLLQIDSLKKIEQTD